MRPGGLGGPCAAADLADDPARRDLMDADAAAESNAEVIARIARHREPVHLTMDDILAARDEGRR